MTMYLKNDDNEIIFEINITNNSHNNSVTINTNTSKTNYSKLLTNFNTDSRLQCLCKKYFTKLEMLHNITETSQDITFYDIVNYIYSVLQYGKIFDVSYSNG